MHHTLEGEEKTQICTAQERPPPSKRTLTSGVSTKVLIERTPRLSAANGTTLIFRSIFSLVHVVLKYSFYLSSVQLCYVGDDDSDPTDLMIWILSASECLGYINSYLDFHKEPTTD